MRAFTFDGISKAFLVVGALLFVGGIARAALMSPAQSNEHSLQATHESTSAKDPTVVSQSLSDRLRNLGIADNTAYFTFWLALFTLILVVISVAVSLRQFHYLANADRSATLSARAAKDAADIANRSLVQVQRAFVFMDFIEHDTRATGAVIIPRWRNSGTTPTRSMTNWVSWKVFPLAPPADFSFPDLDGGGNVVADPSMNAVPTFIGPNSTLYSSTLVIPAESFQAVRDNNATLLIWGWAKYKDIFGVSHITKFCNTMKIELLEQDGERRTNAVSFPLFPRHNCTDEECGESNRI